MTPVSPLRHTQEVVLRSKKMVSQGDSILGNKVCGEFLSLFITAEAPIMDDAKSMI